MSAHVDVLFFASLRDALGNDRLALEVESGATVATLKSALQRTLSAEQYAAVAADEVRIAVNQTLIADDAEEIVLGDGDEVAFMPPITGG